ncbi:hypothetical protein LSUB1_G007231 [Lachnellula subtilissima]|uniref:Myb-like domain-containing protein n=1 Tax=Lachnellula subtilissima TaxID=602034 RepID=A0A8H8U8A8_9HELO|nr:hypothetical protein LSUB1_G007231 [Lachnellula subtilissima]
MSTAPARWTDGEKYSFLLQALKQFGGDRAPDYKKINLTGRTERAMGHQWAAIKKEMSSIGEDGGFAEGSGPKTPSKRGAGKKIDGETPGKKPKVVKKKAPVVEEDEEQAEDASS